MRTINDWVALKRIPKDKSDGGVLLPDSAKKPQEGIVVSPGTGRIDKDGYRLPPETKEGDRVLFLPGAMGAELNGVFIIREENIVGVL